MMSRKSFRRRRQRPQHALVVVLGLRVLKGCSSFQQQQPIVFAAWSRSRQFSTQKSISIHSTTIGNDVDEGIRNVNIRGNDSAQGSNEDSNNVGLELWLDLRGTSLTPNAALELWNLEEVQNNSYRRLHDDEVSPSLKAPFVKCLVSSTNTDDKTHGHTPQNNEKFDHDMDVLLVAEGGDGEDTAPIFHHANPPLSSSKDPVLFGRVLSLQTSSSTPVLPDPLPLMDAISDGQCVILDTQGWKKIEEGERLRMASSIMELISSGAPGGTIGLTCHTKNDVAKAAMFIQTITGTCGGGMVNSRTSTLDSGIVIVDEDGDSSNISASDNAMHRFAIIVPYDMSLLQSYCLLTGRDDNVSS
eukprot:CAMPEP_0181116328 /NCGR_PEP_ID=MMETSP1071-20121207/21891_1 /TAXON_ID=35127 /ORGANISM="Thalassiosira sp., Strain NH16" /LENGTH=357 /DNA_ID=CAMNT_0023200563 /DNA_START=12 /DNA_END=1085 /DNA_ORIENTATION=+